MAYYSKLQKEIEAWKADPSITSRPEVLARMMEGANIRQRNYEETKRQLLSGLTVSEGGVSNIIAAELGAVKQRTPTGAGYERYSWVIPSVQTSEQKAQYEKQMKVAKTPTSTPAFDINAFNQQMVGAPAPKPSTGIVSIGPGPKVSGIITTTDKPKAGVSQIDAGKSAIQELTQMGVSSDINTIRGNWTKFGLNTKLGEWRGTAVQWNAYSKYAKDELERVEAGIKEAQKQATALQEQITRKGITPTETEPTTTEPTTTKPSTPQDLAAVQLSSTDIGNIMTELETEGTPETIITGEETKLLTEQEKSRAADALSKFQQQMATAGQAFSSIRSSGEAQIAAESLARQSGINLDLATKLINAARKEQTNRINANQEAIKARDAALKAQGYVIDPITGTLQRTLERERFEEPDAPRYFGSQGNYMTFDPTTGETYMLYQAPEKDRNLSIRYFTDDVGNVTKVLSDPITGQEVGRESLGKLGRETTFYNTMRMMGYDPNNPDELERFNEDFGITGEQTEEDNGFFDDVLDFIGGIFK